MYTVNGRVDYVAAWYQFLHDQELEFEADLVQERIERRLSRGASRRLTELSEVQLSRRLCWLSQQRGNFYGGHPRRSRRDRRQYDRACL